MSWKEEEQQFISQSAKDINKELDKTWQEEFKTDFNGKTFSSNEQVLDYLLNKITDLRKKDCEAILKMFPKEYLTKETKTLTELIKTCIKDYFQS